MGDTLTSSFPMCFDSFFLANNSKQNFQYCILKLLFCFVIQFNRHWGLRFTSPISLPFALISSPGLQWMLFMNLCKHIMLPLRCLPTMQAWSMLVSPTSYHQDIFSHFTVSPALSHPNLSRGGKSENLCLFPDVPDVSPYFPIS